MDGWGLLWYSPFIDTHAGGGTLGCVTTMFDTDSGSAARRIGTRRQLVASLATLSAGGTLLVVGGSDSARADVTIGDFDAESATLDAGADPDLLCDLAYSYTTPNGADVAELGFELRVGDSTIASASLETSASELEQSKTLRGRLSDADGYQVSDFDVREETAFDLDVSVWFGVLDSAGDEIVSATASDTATLTIDASGQASDGGVVRIVASE